MAQWAKDPAWSLLWLGSLLWCGLAWEFTYATGVAKKKKKELSVGKKFFYLTFSFLHVC